MHGYIDSILIPIHLPLTPTNPSAATTTTTSSKKGKEKAVVDNSRSSLSYNVVTSWSTKELENIKNIFNLASTLGYSTLILTIQIPPNYNPSNLIFPTPLFPLLDPRTAPAGTQNLLLQLWNIEVISYDDAAVKGAGVKGIYGFSNTTSSLYPLHTTLLSSHPTTIGSFSHTCLSLSPPSVFAPSLVTFDPSLSARLPFLLKRGPVNTAQRAGLQFRIDWRGITRLDDPGDAAGGGGGVRRRNWTAGAREIVRATGGVGVVMCSMAREPGELRAPADMINLCTLIGLTPNQARDALSVNPQKAIIRGLSMRQSYRGVISNPTLTTVISTPSTKDSISIENSSVITDIPITNVEGLKRNVEHVTTTAGGVKKKQKGGN